MKMTEVINRPIAPILEDYELQAKALVETKLRRANMLCESIVKDLSIEQKTIVENIYKELYPLIEAALTVDQINQLFQSIEQSAQASGSNRTLLGKGVDVVSKANEIINKIGGWLQNTAPVKYADQKFDSLVDNISKKFPNSSIINGLRGLGYIMKDNPGKSAAIIGVLTAIAALTTGPTGAAIAGSILKGATELIKGEQLSTAAGRSIKAGAVGWLAGKSFALIGDALEKGVQIVADKIYPKTFRFNMKFLADEVGYSNQNSNVAINVLGTQPDVTKLNSFWQQAVTAWERQNYAQAQQYFQQAQTLAARMATLDYLNQLGVAADQRQALINAGKNAVTLIQGLGSAAAQGATTASTGTQLREEEIDKLFQVIIIEQTIIDKLKSGASKAVQYVAQKGQNITNKVTADKLMQLWKKAKSPTDSFAIANILQNAGIKPEVVSQVYKQLNLGPISSPGSQAFGQMVSQISDQPPATSGQKAFGQMASQLTMPSDTASTSTSSGSTVPTPTTSREKLKAQYPNVTDQKMASSVMGVANMIKDTKLLQAIIVQLANKAGLEQTIELLMDRLPSSKGAK